MQTESFMQPECVIGMLKLDISKDPAYYKDYLKDNKHSSLHLTLKIPRIFLVRQYLFLEVHSFPQASLLKNCWIFVTDYVCGQLPKRNPETNGSYCPFTCSSGNRD